MASGSGWQQRSRRGRQGAASAGCCSSACGGTIGFPESDRPDGPRADERYGDVWITRPADLGRVLRRNNERPLRGGLTIALAQQEA